MDKATAALKAGQPIPGASAQPTAKKTDSIWYTAEAENVTRENGGNGEADDEVEADGEEDAEVEEEEGEEEAALSGRAGPSMPTLHNGGARTFVARTIGTSGTNGTNATNGTSRVRYSPSGPAQQQAQQPPAKRQRRDEGRRTNLYAPLPGARVAYVPFARPRASLPQAREEREASPAYAPVSPRLSNGHGAQNGNDRYGEGEGQSEHAGFVGHGEYLNGEDENDFDGDEGDGDGEGWYDESYTLSQAPAPPSNHPFGAASAPAPGPAPIAAPSFGVQDTSSTSIPEALSYAMTAQYWAGYWMGVAQAKVPPVAPAAVQRQIAPPRADPAGRGVSARPAPSTRRTGRWVYEEPANSQPQQAQPAARSHPAPTQHTRSTHVAQSTQHTQPSQPSNILVTRRHFERPPRPLRR